ncbi:MAG: Holliday junction ATP-dependent DNA helicase RuvB [Microgenomates group bacterium GW2011_GWC1_46_16]|uniref:Holliday junction branch migration complex subunit RuvB n=2 Tax=Candidatus Collieribacteriota TaxID=1752725 RepID=A0A1F5FYZ8_9BACT|nr:MAG: Holliday junction ATP-dependent DNA helicase RuvB [Microgenomates group bacterium GW2011_GWF1_46_12]KKU26001.1 MAG: Holliday junction ATP-dependent DNA helicase RuvB [Microgenomates group bacterium GW2011_GWC1_46_16]KKU28188.1 MAG: Holliday junction ATP-dependent DNA helicase RuvB [Microgenomates group bacterium GW2011_GWF2_46_18]KKU43882.1 MAG: Holliday junction ATP-dependent DNA helicase RuvB [Microgenomates group bacterium GW2011_GWA1_46_7]KKU45595.1 MAG: Holliday junction ATP-depend
MIEPLLDTVVSAEEAQLETSLRPRVLTDFVGQPRLKDSLGVALQAAKKRHEPLDHVLLYGPPGLGKTTLAHIISHEQGGNIHVTSGPALTRAGDLAALLTNLEEGDVLFIDEIHRLSKVVEETLYSGMEDQRLDLVLGKGPAARTVSIELKPFTLVGATTRYGALSGPLRSRFGIINKLEYYSPKDLTTVLSRSAKILKIKLDPSATDSLAQRARGTPRIANRLLRRARDTAEIRYHGHLGLEAVTETLKLLEIDALGLDASDRDLLTHIIKHHRGGPVGIETLASALSEDVGTIEEVYEPYLIQQGLLTRTKQGRVVTSLAYTHLKLSHS